MLEKANKLQVLFDPIPVPEFLRSGIPAELRRDERKDGHRRLQVGRQLFLISLEQWKVQCWLETE